MKTWKLISAIISILIGAEILREGSVLYSFVSAFNEDTTYVTHGIMAGVLVLAGGIITLVARSTKKNVYNKIALACYILGLILCLMGPKGWENLLVYSAWPLICAVFASIDLFKNKGKTEEVEKDERPMLKYCKKCGTPLNFGAKFCSKCGSIQ
jgi:hypothetical protein